MAENPDRPRRHLLIAVLVLVQALVFLLVNLASARTWAMADAATYLQQAIALALGGFPSDPARPVFYPFLLSIALKFTGFDRFGLLCFQGAALVLTTVVLYRLGIKLLGRKWALIAAALFVLFPDPYFLAASFYRETLTGLFLLAALNLIQVMLERPHEWKWSFYAGAAAGLLTLIKPEFGSLMAVFALGGLYQFVRGADFRQAVAPWVLCGVTALTVTSPAILAARTHFGEWIFINTYKGFNWYCSYCGKLEDGGSFKIRDNDRYADANRAAVEVLFMADPAESFSDRDGRLLKGARECIKDAPERSAYLYGRRMLDTVFRLDEIAPMVMASGEAGRWWPPWLIALARLSGYGQDLLVVLLIGPGWWALRRRREAGPLVLAVAWFILFYGSVTYFSRFRLAVWPVWLLTAAAGGAFLADRMPTAPKGGRWVVIAWMVLAASGLVGLNVSQWSVLLRGSTWTVDRIGPGVPEKDKKVTLLIYASEFVVRERFDLMDQWLGDYIRKRSDRIEPETLLAAARQTRDRGMGRTAIFFYGMADQVAGREVSEGRIEQLTHAHSVVDLTSWRKGRDDGAMTWWDAMLPAEPLGGRGNLPLEVRVNYGDRRLAFASKAERPVPPYSWSWSGRHLVVVLPAKAPPPGLDHPVKVDYYAEVPEAGLK